MPETKNPLCSGSSVEGSKTYQEGCLLLVCTFSIASRVPTLFPIVNPICFNMFAQFTRSPRRLERKNFWTSMVTAAAFHPEIPLTAYLHIHTGPASTAAMVGTSSPGQQGYSQYQPNAPYKNLYRPPCRLRFPAHLRRPFCRSGVPRKKAGPIVAESPARGAPRCWSARRCRQ